MGADWLMTVTLNYRVVKLKNVSANFNNLTLNSNFVITFRTDISPPARVGQPALQTALHYVFWLLHSA